MLDWKKTAYLVAPCFAALWLPACVSNSAGTDTGNPLIDVQVSSCKSGEMLASSVQALTDAASDSARYDGFTCMRWTREDERLRLDAINFQGGCLVHWKGGLEERDDGVALRLTNPSCIVAACIAGCGYDVSAEIDTSAVHVEPNAEIPLITEEVCESDPITVATWKLPANDAKSGITCDYVENLGHQAASNGLCGQQHMPCRTLEGACAEDTGAPECDPGLRCVSVNAWDSVCLRVCDHDDECPLPEVMTCTEGTCQLRRD